MNKGEATRQRVVEYATKRARRLGLGGITLGTLAEDLSLSKSGLFAHFRSKEQLQLAVLEHSARQFTSLVIAPALSQPRGVPRLHALFSNYMRWSKREGGCPFIAFAGELDDNPGPLRDRLVALTTAWVRLVRRAASEAVKGGEFTRELNVQDFAFEFHSILLGAHMLTRLLGDRGGVRRAQHALRGLLERSRRHK